MIKYLQLNQFFNAVKMRGDLERLFYRVEGNSALSGISLDPAAAQTKTRPLQWKAHYNTAHYEGSWTVIPLRSIGGSLDNIVSIHETGNDAHRVYADTPLLKECPYIKTIVDSFECEKTAVRLMKLNAGAMIKNHRDQELSFENGSVRFHIPIQTNYQVGFYLEEEKIVMQEGECWYLNLTMKHRVQNFGESDRIHLVIDCEVNDWITDNFENNVLTKKMAEGTLTDMPTRDEKLKIIRQLRILNTPVSIQMAERMENELDA